jgi:predicted transcriptional regulator
MGRSAGKKPPGTTKPRQFRLNEDVMARLQRIADARTRETGLKHSRADAIRVLAHEEEQRVLRREGKK